MLHLRIQFFYTKGANHEIEFGTIKDASSIIIRYDWNKYYV